MNQEDEFIEPASGDALRAALDALLQACEWMRKVSHFELSEAGRDRLFYVAATSQHICEALQGDAFHVEFLERDVKSLYDLTTPETLHDPCFRSDIGTSLPRLPVPDYVFPAVFCSGILLVGVLAGYGIRYFG